MKRRLFLILAFVFFTAAAGLCACTPAEPEVSAVPTEAEISTPVQLPEAVQEVPAEDVPVPESAAPVMPATDQAAEPEEPEATAAPENTPLPEPTIMPTATPTNYYGDVVSNVNRAMENGWQDITTDQLDVSPVFSYVSRDVLGYLRMDVNEDGIPELLLGANGGLQGNPIYDIFSLSNGSLIHVFSGSERSYCYLYADGTLLYQESFAFGDEAEIHCALVNGGLLEMAPVDETASLAEISFHSFH